MTKNLVSKKPLNLPDKFWDNDTAEIRFDDFIKSYVELEKKFGKHERLLPNSPSDYSINISNKSLGLDEEVNQKLFAAGFSNEQAQLVYNLAEEKVLPVIAELASEFEADRQLEKLISHFGGEDRWNEVAGQISAWAKQNLKAEIYEALSSTYEGVLALYSMLNDKEPKISENKGSRFERLTEEKLKEMMKDPKYWRDNDKEYHKKIADGFKALYPNSNG